MSHLGGRRRMSDNGVPSHRKGTAWCQTQSEEGKSHEQFRGKSRLTVSPPAAPKGLLKRRNRQGGQQMNSTKRSSPMEVGYLSCNVASEKQRLSRRKRGSASASFQRSMTRRRMMPTSSFFISRWSETAHSQVDTRGSLHRWDQRWKRGHNDNAEGMHGSAMRKRQFSSMTFTVKGTRQQHH